MKTVYLFIFFYFITAMNLLSQPIEEPVTDIDGNTYKTIKIGDQIWMVDFLKTTKYSDGSEIPLVKDKKEWSELDSGAYCNFLNNSKNIYHYGKLYNWHAVKDERGLCPAGWHIPSHKEWIKMDSILRTSTKYNEFKGWWSYQVHGSSYLPPDYRNKEGEFINEDSEIQFNYGGWWTSTYFNQNETWYVTVGFSSYTMMFKKYVNTGGFCVLCIKN